MRTRKLGSHVRTLGRAIRAASRQPSNSRRMAEAIGRMSSYAYRPERVRAYNAAFIKGPNYKPYIRRISA